jgi:hypothetical protein
MSISHWTRQLAILLFLAVLLAGCGKSRSKDHQFSVQDGKLYNGDKEVELRAIEAPGIAKPGTPYNAIAIALRDAAEVGANSLCLDLDGLSKDGSSVSPEAVQAYTAVLHEATERHMAAVCRIFSPTAPADAGYRMAVVKTVAKALAKRGESVYLIQGPDAKTLAAELVKLAPALVVAAPAGGSVSVVDSSTPRSADTKAPILTVGSIPSDLAANPHFIAPDRPEIYQELDKALADPIESLPWTPDNSVLSEQERAEGWIALFDGKTFNGWLVTGDKAGWRVRDGIMEWAANGGGVIRSRDRYENFILRLDWKIEEGGNSGVFLHAPRAGRQSRIGMEAQIQGDHGLPIKNDSTGSIYVQVPPLVDATNPNGEWNRYEITINWPQVKFVLNGQVVQDLNADENPELAIRLKKGFFGLQDHHHYVAFRKIRLKVL